MRVTQPCGSGGQGSTHSGRSSKGQPRGEGLSSGHRVGTETGTAGTGAKPEEGRIPQASWAGLLLQERVVGTRGRTETIA